MTTAVRQGDLQILGQLLEERLQLKFFSNGPLRVQCSRQEETLTVVSQHPDVVVPDPQQIFNTLEQAIKGLQPELTHKVQLYLRRASNKQPYASHAFMMKPQTGSAVEQQSTATRLQEAARVGSRVEKPASKAGVAEIEDIWNLPEGWEFSEPAIKAERANESPEAPAPEQPIPPKPAPAKPSSSSNSLPMLLAGTGVALFLVAAIVYPLSRPCVLGTCQEMKTAKQLSGEAAQTIEQAKSVTAPAEAQNQLAKARGLLRTIPFWSFYYHEAQELLDTYKMQSERLDDIIEIQKKATTAAQKSQNPPHPVKTWLEIQSLWREAITEIEQIPEDSQVYPWRERKLKEYRANLAVINQRVKAEQVAASKLRAGKGAAQIAEARQGVAQSLESWQQVYSTWQTAIQVLQQVPKGTVAHQETQPLLDSYRVQLAQAQERKTSEEISASSYNQALRYAGSAKIAEQRNQWSQAVAYWRQALANTQQVPNGTNYYNQALPLRESYSNALQEAQVRLQSAVALQKARADLRKTCSGKPKICDYTVTNDMMTVYITPEYQKTVRQTAITADRKKDNKSRRSVSNHIKTLQTALEAISNNANIPIQVYDPTGSQIGAHNPRG